MRYARFLGFGAVTLLALAVAGCGGSSSSSTGGSNNPPPSNVSVSISPSSSTVGYGSTQLFTATVIGATNTGVTWSVSSSGSSSSSQIGAISSAGLYTAPAATSVPSASAPQTVSVAAGLSTTGVNVSVPPLNTITSVTVKATSQAETSASASATVTLSGLSILGVGQCTPSATALNCSAGSTGTDVSQGQTTYLFVAGYGILPGTSYSISGNGTDVVVTQPLPSQVQTAPNANGTPVVYFQISVLPGATLGPRNLVVKNAGNELTSFVGAVDIVQ